MSALLAFAVLLSPSQQVWATTQGWTIEQSGMGCTAREGATITLSATKSYGPTTLELNVPQWSARPAIGAVEVQPADDLPRISKMSDAALDGDRLRLEVRPGTMSALFRASGLRLRPRNGRTKALEVPLPPHARIVDMFKRCLDENTRRDPGSGKPVATPGTPTVPIASYIQDYHYPAEALQAGVEGRVGVEVTASAAGLVSDCKVVQTSVNAALDETTCILVSRYARFTPARDADGAATQGVYPVALVWALAE